MRSIGVDKSGLRSLDIWDNGMMRGERLLIADILESCISSGDFQTQVRQGKEELWFLWGWFFVFLFFQINSIFLRLQKRERFILSQTSASWRTGSEKKEPEKEKDSWLCLRTGMEHSIEGLDLNPTISNPCLFAVTPSSFVLELRDWCSDLSHSSKGLGSGLRGPWFGKITGSVCRTLEQAISALAW